MIIAQPLQVTNTIGQFDVIATVGGGGPTGQAGAVRHGNRRALARFDEKLRLPLKKAGLLTRDPRMRERKKYGQPGARQKVPVFEALVPKRRDVVRVAVAGASGYMGAELLRLLLGHPGLPSPG